MGFGGNFTVGGDLDSLGRLRSGRLDYPFMPTKTVPYIKGFLLDVQGMVDGFDQVFTPQFDLELVSIAVGATDYHYQDYWSVFIGDDLPENYILDSIYTKDVPEGVYLMAVRTVTAGTPITFRFQNDNGSAKKVWINFQCLRDEVTTTP